MSLVILIAGAIGIFSFGVLVGKAIFGLERNKKYRTGALYLENKKRQFWVNGEGWQTESCAPVIIVKELGIAGDQSKINIISVEGVYDNTLRDIIRKKIGSYWKTSDIVWGEQTKPKKKNSLEETINTPMSELVKKIEEERVEDF